MFGIGCFQSIDDYFQSIDDWVRAATRAHMLLSQAMPDDVIDEIVAPEPIEVEWLEVA